MDDLQCEFFRKTLPGNVSLGQSGTVWDTTIRFDL